jgi:hypothetical protein
MTQRNGAFKLERLLKPQLNGGPNRQPNRQGRLFYIVDRAKEI